MILAFIFGFLFVGCMAQRPSFAGSRPVGRPELAARFRDDSEPTESSISNRVGEGDAVSTFSSTRIPVDINKQYVDRVNQWPRENRPFEVINAEHIRTALNRPGTQNLQSRSGSGSEDIVGSTKQRSSFAGSGPVGRPELSARFKDDADSTPAFQTVTQKNEDVKFVHYT